MHAKLVMASLKGKQLRTRLELLMPMLGVGWGALFYYYSHFIKGPLYLVSGLELEKHFLQVWLCGAGRQGGRAVCPCADGNGFWSLQLSVLLPLLPGISKPSPLGSSGHILLSPRAVSHWPIPHAVTLSKLHLASLHPFAVLHRPGASLVAQW